MDLKDTIKRKFGTIDKFAKILGAPPGTIYSWTRTLDKKAPPDWQLRSALVAADFKKRKVLGWMCKTCQTIMIDEGTGMRSEGCCRCGGNYFNPVDVLPKDKIK